ncbi:MAG TPA: hypothetical protein VMI31_14220 [Fimbriimonadaceae bacterium]|nr:hypothetical protein [Fimbriimonadaceae bacterium]
MAWFIDRTKFVVRKGRRRRPRWLRHLFDLGPWALYWIGYSADDAVNREWRKAADSVTRKAASRFGLPEKFLRAGLHDGRILDFDIRGDRFRMSVSHENFEWLGLGLNPLVGRSEWPPGMPVDYDFRACSLVAAYRYEWHGALVPFSLQRMARKAEVFLYADAVAIEGDTLVWGCILYGTEVGYVILIVASERPSIKERHREVWLASYGKEWEWVYDAYAKVQDQVSLVNPNAEEFLRSLGLGL